MELLDMGLSPTQFMTAAALERAHGRMGPSELAEIIGASLATAKRTLRALVDKGLITRTNRGRYDLNWMTLEGSSVTLEGSPVTLSRSVEKTVSTSRQSFLVEPNGSTSQHAEPPREGYVVRGFPMADDIIPGKISSTSDDPPAPKRKRSTRQSAMRGWREDPVEDWTIEHIAREFRMRLQQANRSTDWTDLPMYFDGKSLRNALALAVEEHGATVDDMRRALDDFFRQPPKAANGKALIAKFLVTLSSSRIAAERAAALQGESLTDDLVQQYEADYASRPGWGAHV